MLLYAASLSCTKISILLLYRRFLLVGWARIGSNVVLVIVALCSIWVIITSFIDCIPLAAVWDKTIEGKCLSLPVKIGNSVAHVITDFMIFLLPIPFVVSLRLRNRHKIGLMLVFCAGFLCVNMPSRVPSTPTVDKDTELLIKDHCSTCFISIIRIVFIHNLDLSDFTYQMASVSIWGSVEVNLAIICACLPTLKPLVARVFPKLLGSTYTETPGELEYIERPAATSRSVSRTRALTSRTRRKTASFVKLEECEMNDSESARPP